MKFVFIHLKTQWLILQTMGGSKRPTSGGKGQLDKLRTGLLKLVKLPVLRTVDKISLPLLTLQDFFDLSYKCKIMAIWLLFTTLEFEQFGIKSAKLATLMSACEFSLFTVRNFKKLEWRYENGERAVSRFRNLRFKSRIMTNVSSYI